MPANPAVSSAAAALQSLSLSNSLNQRTQVIRGEPPLRTAADAAKERKENHQKWKQAALELPGYPDRVPQTTGDGVATNHFKVTFDGTKELHMYEVKFGQVGKGVFLTPELRRELMSTLLEVAPKYKGIASNYHSKIVSAGTLWDHISTDEPDPGALRNSISCTHRISLADKDSSEIRSTVTYTGRVRMDALQQHVTRTQKADFLIDEHLKALNDISWKYIHSAKWTGGRHGKNFFPNEPSLRVDLKRPQQYRDPKTGITRATRVKVYEARTGFHSSMRAGDGSLILNVNPVTSAFYPTWTLQQLIQARWGKSMPSQKNLTRGELIGLKVAFEGHDPLIGRVYAVSEISGLSVSHQKFAKYVKDQEVYISVFHHMNSKYGPNTPKNLSFDENACCVNLAGKNRRSEWYPADKLHIVDWQVVPGMVDTMFTSDMVYAAKKTPRENQDRIRNFALGPLGIVCPASPQMPQPFLHEFGITINPAFMNVKPRWTRQPSVVYGGDNIIRSTDSRQPATWNLEQVARKLDKNDHKGHAKGRGLLQPAKIDHILLIIRLDSTTEPRRLAKIDDFAGKWLRPALRRYGLTFNSHKLIEAIAQPGRANTIAALNAAGYQLTNEKPKQILVVLPSKNDDYFSDVKHWGDCLKGVPIMCVTYTRIEMFYDDKTPERKRDSTLANISLKFNFKLGGKNHEVRGGFGLFPNTMIVGSDVTHPGKGFDPNAPSIAGLVASHTPFPGGKGAADEHLYRASARVQSRNTEFIGDLRGMMVERLRTYRHLSGQTNLLPEHIFFLRDGVSDSQFGMVLLEELPQIHAAIKLVQDESGCAITPMVTLIVVGKRHHVRFYTTPASDQNLPAGLIVNQTIVAPDQFSFYLQSHDSPIGTARSGHYVVIKNESGYTLAQLQEITNKLCFTGSRATKGLSICTPARYADILCDRLRCFMKPVFNGQHTQYARHSDYERDPSIWGLRRDRFKIPEGSPLPNFIEAPWHPDLDNVMWYL